MRFVPRSRIAYRRPTDRRPLDRDHAGALRRIGRRHPRRGAACRMRSPRTRSRTKRTTRTPSRKTSRCLPGSPRIPPCPPASAASRAACSARSPHHRHQPQRISRCARPASSAVRDFGPTVRAHRVGLRRDRHILSAQLRPMTMIRVRARFARRGGADRGSRTPRSFTRSRTPADPRATRPRCVRAGPGSAGLWPKAGSAPRGAAAKRVPSPALSEMESRKNR